MINRKVLDFDHDKICSVTLATTNIYACLTCGKFFQGRAQATPVYLHALNEGHEIAMNLSNGQTYSVLEGIEIEDPSLDDIRMAIYPVISLEHLKTIETNIVKRVDLHGKEYYSGVLGLLNNRSSDYINVVLQMLTHIEPIRDLFLFSDLRSLPSAPSTPILQAFGLFARKLYNNAPFKATISPHEILQVIQTASNDRFTPIKQCEPIDFLAWFCNTLERAVSQARLPSVFAALKGQLKVSKQKVFLDNDRQMEEFYDMIADKVDVKTVPYYFLALDLPPTPLFQDPTGKNPIPQVSLIDLLQRYNGVQITSKGDSEQTFELLALPRFLILHIKRMVKMEFGMEKKRTIVNFPVKDLNIGQHHYDLVANISHEGELVGGRYFCHLRHKGTDTWFQVRDAEIKEIHSSTIFLTDSCIQVWELRS